MKANSASHPLQPHRAGLCEAGTRVLGRNARKLAPSYVKAARRQHNVPGPFQISFMVPAVPLSPEASTAMAIRTCASCGHADPKFNCSRCQADSYCSRSCQKSHWKQHKPACQLAVGEASPPRDKQPGASSDVCTASNDTSSSAGSSGRQDESVLVKLVNDGSDEDTMNYSSTFNLRWPMREQTADKLRIDDCNAAPPNVHGHKRFLVKVQAPLLGAGQMPLLSYDKDRSFQRMVMPSSPAYVPLLARIRANQQHACNKAYFWAARESETAMRVFLQLPPQQHAWRDQS
ncbi:hypothetical protein WJX72_008831 [[Myrmecia] bisecta]|uniref:MYND-type domain-containing protein n=1 Tax=[Myrmecia] bisecta TaxID=41462 RepID=A0AAW1QRY8_9CHLO